MVVLFQRGAMDGLNVVVPFGERNYYNLRPTIAIPEPRRGNGDAAIDLDGFFGLHPSLAPLMPIYQRRELAIVHAVGSPDPNALAFRRAGFHGIRHARHEKQPTTAGSIARCNQCRTKRRRRFAP